MGSQVGVDHVMPTGKDAGGEVAQEDDEDEDANHFVGQKPLLGFLIIRFQLLLKFFKCLMVFIAHLPVLL